MAFLYDDANTGVFRRVGKILKYINSRLASATTTLPAELTAIVDLYEAADYPLQIEGLASAYEGFKQTVVAQRQTLASFIDRTLLDRDTVLDELGLTTADLNAVLAALHQQMLTDSETINRSTVSLGSVTVPTVSTNQGNGVVLVTRVLDGYSPPIVGALSHIRYNGLNSELAVPTETMVFTCTADSMTGGTSEGAEQFAWKGGIKGVDLDYQTEGSGDGPTITVANAATLINDGGFENWTNTNTPSSWTIDNGSAGTHILRESTNFYRGTYSMKFTGTGAAATIGVSQNVSSSVVKSRRRYLFGARIKASAVPAAGQIEIHFAGTGYSKTSPTAEVQTLQISGTPTSGNYTISWVGPNGGTQTTGNIAFDATSATVQTALRALSGLESVVVTTSAGAPPDVTHTITFRGVPGNVNAITADITGLAGGTPAKSIATTTPGVEGDCIVLPAAAFPTGWLLAYAWINLPAIIPSDWEMVIQVANTLSNGVSVYIDDFILKECDYHGGIGAVAVAGSTRFIQGDKFSVAVTNDAAGVFQEFFRKRYAVQLPSSGSSSIADSLAT